VTWLVNWFDEGPGGPIAPLAVDPEVERIASVGRVAPQKAPEVFAAVVAELRASGLAVEPTWVGAGQDSAGTPALDRIGARVTGWLPAGEVPAVLAAQSLYLHTAAWEAAVPLAVLEAMRAGLVVVVRRTAAYRDMLPDAWQFDDVAGAVSMIRALRDPESRRARLEAQSATLRAFAERRPGNVLPSVYRQLQGDPHRG
jgi:glycosyltransferase involved in cell wall biosynthesis